MTPLLGDSSQHVLLSGGGGGGGIVFMNIFLTKFFTLLLITTHNVNTMPIPVSRGIGHRSATARLLRLYFRILPGTWMSVVCVLSG